MAVFKCKMCGGTIEFEPGSTVGVCDSCGTKQTLPRLDDDRRANLYDRANHFRRNNDFDKAAGIYEQILNEEPTDAEAYWSLVLCRYGIEYVEDPATHKRVPTVNRAQYTSIFEDANYKAALKHADSYQRSIYEVEAATINEIQKGILAISQKEEPFDVFICYKETDPNGRRTQDSVLANDLYHQLTNEGFKVFFSRITLEDKLGTAYEPYIFAALNSAKVMVVLGTKSEYFNAVWVKNEWSRYLALVKQSNGKKTLIPAYRDMDPYDLPDEFSHLQAQDMSKLGFMQDLIRGIKKLTERAIQKETARESASVGSSSVDIAPLLKRAFMFLEDGEWSRADDFCEQVLNKDPENAQAYLAKLMADVKCRHQEDLKNCEQPFDGKSSYQKAYRFGDEKIRGALSGYIEFINNRNERSRLTGIYNNALQQMKSASSERAFTVAAESFRTISGFEDADAKAEECLREAETARKDAIYASAISAWSKNDVPSLESAIKAFSTISGWKDANEQTQACRQRIKEIKVEEERQRLENERKAEELRIATEKARKKRKKAAAISGVIGVVAVIVVIIVTQVIIPNRNKAIAYKEAMTLLEAEKYDEAISAFEILGDYRDSHEQINNARAEKDEAERIRKAEQFQKAVDNINNGKLEDAISILNTLGDAYEGVNSNYHDIILSVSAGGDNEYAYNVMKSIPDSYYKENEEDAYSYALILFQNGNTDNAKTYFNLNPDYKDAGNYLKYIDGTNAVTTGDYSSAITNFSAIPGFLDSNDILGTLYYMQVVSNKTMTLSDAISCLNQASTLSNDGKNALALYKDLQNCIGTYACYQTKKRDGTITDRDISYRFTFDIYLKNGVPYMSPSCSLFAHDLRVYEAEVMNSTEGGYTYMTKHPNNRNGIETVFFSSTEARYGGLRSDSYENMYYLRKR